MRYSVITTAILATTGLATAGLASCGSDGGSHAGTSYFDLTGAVDGATIFWNLPFPSDLRVTPDGAPDFTGFPNPHARPIVAALLGSAGDRVGAPVMPVAWFRFSTAIDHAYASTDTIAADVDSPIQLLDIDADSPERGTAYPVVAQNLIQDDFTADHLLGVAPRPGVVLRGKTTYAIVVRKGFADGPDGADDIAPAPGFQALIDDQIPTGSRGPKAAEIFAPLWPILAARGIPRDDLVVGTVFTTGDEVQLLRDRSENVRGRYDATIGPLVVDPDDGDQHDGFCELVGHVTLPQFQTGVAPFATDGTFILLGDGGPMQQSSLSVPITLTLPDQQMPAGGWPLFQFFHGSGGKASHIVDYGFTATPEGAPEVGKGPSWVVARYGIATVSSALPVNPERVPGASESAYLNLSNLTAFPFTFQQGVFEQRLLLDALLTLQISPASVASCSGLSLPSCESTHHFDATKLMAGGQSMGGMYTNPIGAVEDRYGALVPSGAGGYWNYFILDTASVPGSRDLLAAQFITDAAKLSFLHPGLALIAYAWEIAEPMVSMSRIAHRPLAGFHPRHVYESTPFGDEYFPSTIYDAAALAYGNNQAGDVVWPTMQDALATAGLDGVLSYPVKANRENTDGSHTTAVAAQYQGDGIIDPHYIYRQLESVKHQYGCFLSTYVTDGVPTVSAPGAITDACQHAP